jgi:molybdopterin-guanine dinucleotide biosynthesis protein A
VSVSEPQAVPERDPIAAVIAGGAGSRLGGSKPTAILAGEPLIARPVAAAVSAGFETIVVAKPGTALPELRVEVLRESDPRVHPLTGILAALEANPRRAVIAIACDLPFLPSGLIAELATGEERAATIEAGGRLQPLIARYGTETAPALRTALCRGGSASDFLASLEPRVIGEDELRRFGDPEEIAFNVNTPEDLADAESRLA